MLQTSGHVLNITLDDSGNVHTESQGYLHTEYIDGSQVYFFKKKSPNLSNSELSLTEVNATNTRLFRIRRALHTDYVDGAQVYFLKKSLSLPNCERKLTEVDAAERPNMLVVYKIT